MSPEHFAEMMRVIRETVRAEMRAEFEGRAEAIAKRAAANAWGQRLNGHIDRAHPGFNPDGLDL